jgi:hypothetical protein
VCAVLIVPVRALAEAPLPYDGSGERHGCGCLRVGPSFPSGARGRSKVRRNDWNSPRCGGVSVDAYGSMTIELYNLSDAARLASASADRFPVRAMLRDPKIECGKWVKHDFSWDLQQGGSEATQ